MARNSDLTIDQISEEVGYELGGSSLEVELSYEDYEKCIKDAIRLYNRFLPMRHRKSMSLSTSQKKYELAAADHPGLVGVVEVQFVTDTHRDDYVDPFNYEEQTLAGLTAMGGETFGEILQRRGYIEDSRRIVSAEPEWFGQWEPDGKYYLYVSIHHTPVYCSYDWNSHYTPDNDASTGMQWIPAGDVQWVIDYTAARAKQLLARVRGKFQGITTPDGNTDPLDFQELRDEGREAEQQLREAIESRRRPLPPVIE